VDNARVSHSRQWSNYNLMVNIVDAGAWSRPTTATSGGQLRQMSRNAISFGRVR